MDWAPHLVEREGRDEAVAGVDYPGTWQEFVSWFGEEAACLRYLAGDPDPGPDAPRDEYVARALEMIPNTSPFDVTGHPALTVPAALADGLPVGMMVIGRHFDEATVPRVGRAYEQLVGGFPMPAGSRTRAAVAGGAGSSR